MVTLRNFKRRGDSPNLGVSGSFLCIVPIGEQTSELRQPGTLGKIRGVPSTVRNFMTSSGYSMKGALPKKERVPTVLGVAQF